MPAGVSGFISFHFAVKPQNFTFAERQTFHVPRQRDISLYTYGMPDPKEVILLSESKPRDLSVEFSVNTIKLCENIKGHSSLVNQLERSATSIGANIHEANYAHGKPDIIAKMQIALKECYETEYWLEVFAKSGILDRETAKDIYNQCGAIRRMLIASINTAKETAKG